VSDADKMGCASSTAVSEYDDYDWNALPDDIKNAAKTLGYDEQIWDSDGKTPSDEKDWEELTAEQQAAAKVLGYDEEKWDGGD